SSAPRSRSSCRRRCRAWAPISGRISSSTAGASRPTTGASTCSRPHTASRRCSTRPARASTCARPSGRSRWAWATSSILRSPTSSTRGTFRGRRTRASRWIRCPATTRGAGSSTWPSAPATRPARRPLCGGIAPTAMVPRVRASIVRSVLSLLLVVPLAGARLAHAAAPASGDSLSGAGADSLAGLRDVGDVLARVLRRPVPTEVVKEARPGLSLTFLPSLGYNPSYGAFAGLSVSVGGWLGKAETTQLSSGSLGASYSTTGQISVQFRSDFYLPDNSWVLKGDWRYLDTSQDTYGL